MIALQRRTTGMTHISISAEHQGRTVDISIDEELEVVHHQGDDIESFDSTPGITSLIDVAAEALKAALR